VSFGSPLSLSKRNICIAVVKEKDLGENAEKSNSEGGLSQNVGQTTFA
jgi:hypothetical protein